MLVAEAIEELEILAGRMASVAAKSEDNPAVLLGATRVQERILMDKIALMQATGLLPHDLGTIRHLHDVRALVVKIVAVMRERNVPVEVLREIEQIVGP